MGPWTSPHSKQDYHQCHTIRSAVPLSSQVVKSLQGRSCHHLSGAPGDGFPKGQPELSHLPCVAIAPCYVLWHLQGEFGWLCHLCTCSSDSRRLLFHHPLGSSSLGKTSPAPSTSLTLHLRSRAWTVVAALGQTCLLFSRSPLKQGSQKRMLYSSGRPTSAVQMSGSICWLPSFQHC